MSAKRQWRPSSQELLSYAPIDRTRSHPLSREDRNSGEYATEQHENSQTHVDEEVSGVRTRPDVEKQNAEITKLETRITEARQKLANAGLNEQQIQTALVYADEIPNAYLHKELSRFRTVFGRPSVGAVEQIVRALYTAETDLQTLRLPPQYRETTTKPIHRDQALNRTLPSQLHVQAKPLSFGGSLGLEAPSFRTRSLAIGGRGLIARGFYPKSAEGLRLKMGKYLEQMSSEERAQFDERKTWMESYLPTVSEQDKKILQKTLNNEDIASAYAFLSHRQEDPVILKLLANVKRIAEGKHIETSQNMIGDDATGGLPKLKSPENVAPTHLASTTELDRIEGSMLVESATKDVFKPFRFEDAGAFPPVNPSNDNALPRTSPLRERLGKHQKPTSWLEVNDASEFVPPIDLPAPVMSSEIDSENESIPSLSSVSKGFDGLSGAYRNVEPTEQIEDRQPTKSSTPDEAIEDPTWLDMPDLSASQEDAKLTITPLEVADAEESRVKPKTLRSLSQEFNALKDPYRTFHDIEPLLPTESDADRHLAEQNETLAKIREGITATPRRYDRKSEMKERFLKASDERPTYQPNTFDFSDKGMRGWIGSLAEKAVGEVSIEKRIISTLKSIHDPVLARKAALEMISALHLHSELEQEANTFPELTLLELDAKMQEFADVAEHEIQGWVDSFAYINVKTRKAIRSKLRNLDAKLQHLVDTSSIAEIALKRTSTISGSNLKVIEKHIFDSHDPLLKGLYQSCKKQLERKAKRADAKVLPRDTLKLLIERVTQSDLIHHSSVLQLLDRLVELTDKR